MAFTVVFLLLTLSCCYEHADRSVCQDLSSELPELGSTAEGW